MDQDEEEREAERELLPPLFPKILKNIGRSSFPHSKN